MPQLDEVLALIDETKEKLEAIIAQTPGSGMTSVEATLVPDATPLANRYAVSWRLPGDHDRNTFYGSSTTPRRRLSPRTVAAIQQELAAVIAAQLERLRALMDGSGFHPGIIFTYLLAGVSYCGGESCEYNPARAAWFIMKHYKCGQKCCHEWTDTACG